MKFQETSFVDYMNSYDQRSLHPELAHIYENGLPSKLEDLKNLIFYGPSGSGKYTQMLAAIRKYSPSEFKYEKKISVIYNKNTYLYKISDIHFEVDMSLLGCQSKQLWNEIYNHIVDIVLAKTQTHGIIVCKNFHEIHSELLDSFYSYMQQYNTGYTVDLKIIMLTEQISFIPDSIIQCSQVIRIPKPTKDRFMLCFPSSTAEEPSISTIRNLKHAHMDVSLNQFPLNEPHVILSAMIVDTLLNDLNFATLREQVYSIFIYNLDVLECIWYIVDKCIKKGHLNQLHMPKLFILTSKFIHYYNNNHRPIYHVENYMLALVQLIQTQVA